MKPTIIYLENRIADIQREFRTIGSKQLRKLMKEEIASHQQVLELIITNNLNANK